LSVNRKKKPSSKGEHSLGGQAKRKILKAAGKPTSAGLPKKHAESTLLVRGAKVLYQDSGGEKLRKREAQGAGNTRLWEEEQNVNLSKRVINGLNPGEISLFQTISIIWCRKGFKTGNSEKRKEMPSQTGVHWPMRRGLV